MQNADKFNEVITFLGTLGGEIEKVPEHIKKTAQEIRIRLGKPIIIQCSGGSCKVSQKKVSRAELDSCIEIFCGYSVHSFQREFSQGYITLKGGHRAGFCGTAVVKNGVVETVKNISGINIRIASEHIGCAEKIFCYTDIFAESFKGLLICGKPMSGKTTMLRDLARIIGASSKLCIIDERSEIAAVYAGFAQNKIGENTDVLDGYPKLEGIRTAIRVMSPEFIMCDEVTGNNEFAEACVSGGVKSIFSFHSADIESALGSNIVKNLLDSRVISSIIQLAGGKNIGEISESAEVRNGKLSVQYHSLVDRNDSRNLFFSNC